MSALTPNMPTGMTSPMSAQAPQGPQPPMAQGPQQPGPNPMTLPAAMRFGHEGDTVHFGSHAIRRGLATGALALAALGGSAAVATTAEASPQVALTSYSTATPSGDTGCAPFCTPSPTPAPAPSPSGGGHHNDHPGHPGHPSHPSHPGHQSGHSDGHKNGHGDGHKNGHGRNC